MRESHIKFSHLSIFCAFLCALSLSGSVYRILPAKNNGILSESDKNVLVQNSIPSAGSGATVIVTAATFNYMDFLRNLRCTIKRSTPHEVVVFPLDMKTSKALKDENIPQISRFVKYNKYENRKTSEFNSLGFNYVSKLKLLVVQEVLRAGINVIYTDLDIIWCKDPVSHLLKYVNNTVDIAIQNDASRDSGKRNLNSGFYFARTSPRILRFYKTLLKYAFENEGINDQKSFIRIACTVAGPGKDLPFQSVREGEVRVCRWDKLVTLFALPLSLYPNGASFHDTTRMYQLPKGKILSMCQKKDIYIWHNNWSSANDKKTRFIAHKLWMIDDKSGKCKSRNTSVFDRNSK
ncbi:Beta-arabinofuranosyltransferase RAY1 [Gracilariopsis chorda]|uniref:Beta-arabinofuranosyltransferase RAY1 n=1 Tax=Gracilariopsis chorda TaxID=448386 RepID=A0A2V3IIP4_9FLOR|nr:Beta-arabinofuranosyltransferase RAY1 [Gracilariopsis chorda]|eukprot:PXF41964.1 Beta-arabinofuranosyltransferase RAY1 [Gracilariopsis chorda]